MRSVIFREAVRFLLPLLLLFSVFLLVRGHNQPGGGFVGGLTAAGGFALYAFAFGREWTLKAMRLDPLWFITIGLSIAFLSGVPGMLIGAPFMTGLWPGIVVPVFGKLGTPVIFDIGVYFTVIGVMTAIFFAVMEE